MSSNISINSATQQVAANSGSTASHSGKSGQTDGKFSEHLADAAVDKKTDGGLNEGGEVIVDSELPTDELAMPEAAVQEVEVPDVDVRETEVLDVEPEEIDLGNSKTPVKTGDVKQVDLNPVATDAGPSVDAAGTVEETAVPPAIASAEVVKSSNVGKTQSEGAPARPAAAVRASNMVGKRENVPVDQGEIETKDLLAGDVDDPLETVKRARTMERPLSRTVGRGRAHDVIESKVEGEKGMRPELTTPNSNGALKAERPANAAPHAFGQQGVESRLASMMEASGTFEGDVKITVAKQENHILPATSQQLTVTGMSRTLVSQILELRGSGELEMTGLDVKTIANKPVKVIEVQLMPRNLGTVGITIRNVAGRINISIEVQGAEAERLIKNEVDKIAGAIRQAGQVLEDITIKRGVQMSQQSDSLTDDRETGRQGEASFGQNSSNPAWQSPDGETDGASNRQRFSEIGIQESGEIASSSNKPIRSGIYL